MPDLWRQFNERNDGVLNRTCPPGDAGVDPVRIELWYHEVDDGGSFMDWPSSKPDELVTCRLAVAAQADGERRSASVAICGLSA